MKSKRPNAESQVAVSPNAIDKIIMDDIEKEVMNEDELNDITPTMTCNKIQESFHIRPI